MMSQFLRFNRLPSMLFALFFALLLSGCAVKYVADYDAAAFEEILVIAKKVDKFYGTLLETKPESRQYSSVSDQYVNLGSDIQGIVTRNQARALNSESTEISRIIHKLFDKYKEQHKSRNTYTDGNAKLDRGRLVRLFAAAASAEEAKKLSNDDKNADVDSK